jgi:uncharacterized membrane protein YgcG
MKKTKTIYLVITVLVIVIPLIFATIFGNGSLGSRKPAPETSQSGSTSGSGSNSGGGAPTTANEEDC